MAALPASLIDKLQKGEVIPFVGAGVSRAVTGQHHQPLFPTWKQLLERAIEKLKADQHHAKAKRAEGALEDNDYLEAAQHARAGLGAHWYPFLKAQFDPDLAQAHPLE